MEISRKTPDQAKGKQVLLWTVSITGFVTAVARIVTAFYYSAVMPRWPEPMSGRLYPAGAAYNTAVYVTRRELQWINFLNYDLMTFLGLGIVLLAVTVIIPKARREGKL